MNVTMQEVASASSFWRWSFRELSRLVKPHRLSVTSPARNEVKPFSRQPSEMLVSFLHFANAEKQVKFSSYLTSIVDLAEMRLDAYYRFQHSGLPDAGLLLRYGHLPADLAATFGNHVLDANSKIKVAQKKNAAHAFRLCPG